MKVILVIANYAWFGKRPWKGITTAVPIITTVLKDKFDLSVIDANINGYSEKDVKQKLKENMESSQGAVLITALSAEYFKAYHTVARLSKEVLPDIPVIMGGCIQQYALSM